MKKLLHKIGIHFNKKVKSAGVHDYYECEICGKRFVAKNQQGYSPIDWDWVNRTKPVIMRPPTEIGT